MKIKEEKTKNIIKEKFGWREIFKDLTSQDDFLKIISNNKQEQTFYVGIDPTADDLHIGHLLSFISVKLISEEFKLNPIFIMGGFTATIGDPSGKNDERKLIDLETINKNSKSIEKRIEYLCKKLDIKNSRIINNLDFYKKMDISEFYRLFGKNFNLSKMLSKDISKKRLEDGGISYTEFSYQIFQAVDFYFLHKDHKCKMQIGGSDQWGNILSGIELIKKLNSDISDVVGLTTNLILDKNGNKIGKSVGKPLWVNEDKTSSYRFYQYFLNLDDESALNLLKSLTLISEKEFLDIDNKQKESPSKRFAQLELADKFISTFYSKISFEKAKEISQNLFSKNYEAISKEDLTQIVDQIPTFTLKQLKLETSTLIIDFLIKFEFIKSKREAREFIVQKAIKINNSIFENEDFTIQDLDKFKINSYDGFIIDIGKHKKLLIL